ncbi:MAG: lysophospholipid acyltransferase family protein [Rhizobiaceae bacterium]
MIAMRSTRVERFPELSYANAADSRLKQWLIRRVERYSGRDHFAELYDTWRSRVVGHSERVMGDMLALINIGLSVRAQAWPPEQLPDTPLVIIANHPFGIGDGIAVLALAEQIDRPFRVLINKELLKVPEIRPYSLPIDFTETREAVEMNLQTRKEAVRLLREGVTIVVFPAGGVATAPKGLGKAQDLPWKAFPARLIQAAGASVIPVFFEGQNGTLFQLASKLSLTMRLSLLIREFRRLAGKTITAHVGPLIPASDLADMRDRKVLTDYLHQAVFSMRPARRRNDEQRADARLAA